MRKSKQLEDQLQDTDRALGAANARYAELKQKSEDLEDQINKERRKSKELNKERQKEIDANIQLQIEKEDLRRSSLILQHQYEEEKRKSQTLEKELQTIKEAVPSKDIGQLTMQTFETVNFPDVIAISTPLSDKEMKYFGKDKCPCRTSVPALLDKMLKNGIDSLELEELQFVHSKISDATAAALQKLGQATGVLRPNESDKLSLMRRIAALEEDLKQKQKHAQLKVKSEKQKLTELRKTLDEEKQKNSELLSRMGVSSKSALEKQKLAKMEHYLDIINEEKAKDQRIKEPGRERSNAEKLKELLKASQSKPSKRDSDGSESLRARSLTGEMMLRMKGQEKPKRRSSSPSSLAPVKDVGHSVPTSSRSKHPAPAFYTDIKPGLGHLSCVSRKTFPSKPNKSKEDSHH
nr:unnamed protein product [Callosobruchus chinensis]